MQPVVHYLNNMYKQKIDISLTYKYKYKYNIETIKHKILNCLDVNYGFPLYLCTTVCFIQGGKIVQKNIMVTSGFVGGFLLGLAT